MPFVPPAGTNAGQKGGDTQYVFRAPVYAYEGAAFFSLQFVTLKLCVASN